MMKVWKHGEGSSTFFLCIFGNVPHAPRHRAIRLHGFRKAPSGNGKYFVAFMAIQHLLTRTCLILSAGIVSRANRRDGELPLARIQLQFNKPDFLMASCFAGCVGHVFPVITERSWAKRKKISVDKPFFHRAEHSELRVCAAYGRSVL